MRSYASILLLFILNVPLAWTQASESSFPTPPLPNVIKFAGAMKTQEGLPVSGKHAITFAFYSEPSGGSPVWTETQTLMLDRQGRYSALLGSTVPEGIPLELFDSRQTQWVGVASEDGVEGPRIPFTTVPYAFTAANADALGGKLSDDFVTKQELNIFLNGSDANTPALRQHLPISFPIDPPIYREPSFEATTPTGPSFLSDAIVGPPFSINSSALVQNLNVDFLHGLTDAAFAKLQTTNSFQPPQTFLGGVTLGLSTTNSPGSSGSTFVNSAPLSFISSSQNPGTGLISTQEFNWISQPPLLNSSKATLSLLFGINAAPPTQTGLSINSDGTINFAPDQQFPTQAVLNALQGSASNPNGSPIVPTNQFQWTATPNGKQEIHPGMNVVTLTPCPRGVNGSDLWHYLYISGTGTPEIVLISGGNCLSGAKQGTIQFSAAYPHAVGYTIGTASDGFQEALIAAVEPNTDGQISRQVVISPGQHLLRARVSIRSSSIQVTSSGATLKCAMRDTCIMVGDPSNAGFQQIVLSGLRVIPGVPNGTWPAVEDNGQGTLVQDFGPAPGAANGASFGSLIQVDNDQAALINQLNSNLGPWGRCDIAFCSTAIVGPGPFLPNAGVLWVENSNLPLECLANGIDNQDSNSLRILNTVIEGYPEFAVRSQTAFVASNVQMTGGYTEVGNCVSPLGTGQAGLIVEGGEASVYGVVGGPQGALPQFANTGGSTVWYYIVVHSSTMGTSAPYLAGYATINGSGPISVKWNKVGKVGVITYDVLRVNGNVAPFGTGSFAVAMGMPASECVDGVCSYEDNAASMPLSYAVSGNGYLPVLFLWPGNVILTTGSDTVDTGGLAPTQLYTDSLGSGVIISSFGSTAPSVFAQECDPQSVPTNIWIQCLGGNALTNDNPDVIGTLLQLSSNGGAPGGLKGRLIFEIPPGGTVGATHVVTIADSNSEKTLATPGNRPSWDANDTYIGYDQQTNVAPSQTQLSIGAPISISHYIGNRGDGFEWGERLVKYQKLFNVPVQANSNLTVDGNLILNGSCEGSSCGPFSASGAQVLDSFNEAATGPLSSNWTVTAGSWSIAGGQASYVADGTPSDDSAMAVYTAQSFSPNQRASATVTYQPGGTTAGGVGVRMSPDSKTGYICFAAPTLTMILKYVNGQRMAFPGVAGPAFPSGDTLTATVQGNTVTCYDNGAPIPGVSMTDISAPLTSGSPGIFGEYAYSSLIGSFRAGDAGYVATAPTALASLTQSQPNSFGGSCTMSSSTTCQVPYTATYAVPMCVGMAQGTNPIAASCSVCNGNIMITAASLNSETWAAFVFGNPN
jgi:hypothetical protein